MFILGWCFPKGNKEIDDIYARQCHVADEHPDWNLHEAFCTSKIIRRYNESGLYVSPPGV